MNSIFDKETFAVEIVHVIGGSEQPWVCMEAVVSAKTLEGESVSSQLFGSYLFSIPPLLEEEGEWEGYNVLHSFVQASLALGCLSREEIDRRKSEILSYLLCLVRLGVFYSFHSRQGLQERIRLGDAL